MLNAMAFVSVLRARPAGHAHMNRPFSTRGFVRENSTAWDYTYTGNLAHNATSIPSDGVASVDGNHARPVCVNTCVEAPKNAGNG